MNISRLTKGINLHRGDRFILFYGKVNDQFCDDDLVMGNINFMLWRYFKKQGYQRIIFFDGASKITFYDDGSRKLCLPRTGLARQASPSLSGPLGKRKLWPKSASRNTADASAAAATGSDSTLPGDGGLRQQSRMSDLSALEILDFVMRDNDASPPTVIIFTLAEDIRYLEQAGFREIQNRIVHWVRDSQRTHKCVFIFQQSTLEEVKQIAQTHELHGVSNFIKEKGDDTFNIVGVGFPDEQEIANLIHLCRLRDGLAVDWKILDNAAQFLAKQRLLMQNLNAMLSSIGELSKNTLLAWNREKLVKSTEHLIQNIEKDADVLDGKSLKEKFSAVYCQEDNISQLIDDLETWYAKLKKSRPLSLFLAGTSGVGKTYTAELLSEALQPLGYEYCYFAMNEFSQEHTVSNLIGSPRGYVGSEEEPRLFAALNRSPRLVIVFDEIEKAHEKIFTALMQLLDKGFLSWNRGEGDFTECIVCFTSNIQRQKLVDLKNHFKNSGKPTAEPEFQNAVRDILVRAAVAPEICGRINRFLVYNPLTPAAIVQITLQEIKKLAKSYGLEVESIAPEFLAEVAQKTANSPYGARPVQEMVSAKLGGILARFKPGKKSAAGPLIISKTASGYGATAVVDGESIPADEQILDRAVKIYQESTSVISYLDTKQLAQQLSPVHCQEDNISQLVDDLDVWYAKLKKSRPRSFFLGGTSGVGKTYTVKLLAKALLPLGYEYCYFAMNEFSQEHTVTNLIGSPRGYVGSEDEPKLFAALNRSPRLVILFDEIEKAHEKILKALMQLLDEGFLSWSKGEGDFRECVVCFTSNAEMQQLVDLKDRFQRSGKPTAEPEFQNAVRDILVRAAVAPEICGRINRFLVYNPLAPAAIVQITWQEIKELASGYGLEAESIAPEFLAEVAQKAAGSTYGARPIRDEVETKLGKTLIAFKKDRPGISKVVIEKGSTGYRALSAEEAAILHSVDEMFIRAESLIGTNPEKASSAITTSGGKPKRLLRLDDLPALLPEKSALPASETDLLRGVLPAIAYVDVQEQGGNESSGSGFVITPDGKFITSYHVIENAVSIRVRFDHRPGEWISAEFMDGDQEADIAVLKLEGDIFPYALLAAYGERTERGEAVGLLGYPLGEELAGTVSYTQGAVSNFRLRATGVGLLQIDANAYHGSSGGPLVRLRDGRVIGILKGGWKEAAQINFAVSINELYKRLLSEF